MAQTRTYPVSQFVECFKSGMTIEKISKKFNVCQPVVSRELNKKSIVTVKAINNEDKFLSLYRVNENSNCWEWIGTVNRGGYGQMSIKGRVYTMHRYSYMYFKGEVGTKFVCHNCDNPKCINPDHLFLGTQSDNMRDRSKKGRNPLVKLDPQSVLKIREQGFTGRTYTSIAKEFSVSPKTIRFIIKGWFWSHV